MPRRSSASIHCRIHPTWASKLWALAPGDLIYTGTPEGVGPLVRGDLVEGEVEGVGKLSFRIV